MTKESLPGPRSGDFGGNRQRERVRMVEEQLAARDISDQRVLDAMKAVPRERFVPVDLLDEAYADRALPIGHGQTIAQPYIVALMAQLLSVNATDRVLEIGTGGGYAAAVLSRLAAEVCTVEIVPELARRAVATLAEVGVGNVACRCGDGRAGWPERAAFAGIAVAAVARVVAPAWAEQLAEGGRLVVPLGDACEQWLHCYTKSGGRLHDRKVLAVRFVPLV